MSSQAVTEVMLLMNSYFKFKFCEVDILGVGILGVGILGVDVVGS